MTQSAGVNEKRKKRAPDEGTLSYDHGRGVWVGRLPRSVDPKRRAVYGKTQRQARERLRQAILDAEKGLVALTENSRLADYLDPTWLGVVRARVASGKLAPATAVGYERAVRRHIKPGIGQVPLRKLTPGQVDAMLGALRARSYKPATLRHVRATLSKALRDAERDGLVARNVARLSDPPHIDKKHPSAFSVDEFVRITQACSNDRLGPLYLFAALSGLRRSEALGLRWGDVDLDAGVYRVREGLHQISKIAERVTGAKGLVTSRPKTEASGNSMPLSSRAVAILSEHHTKQTAERLRCRQPWPNAPEDTHVFASVTGSALHPSNVSRHWRQLLAGAEVPNRTPDGRPRGMHELRRTFATRLRDRGVPLEDVQRLGRWSSSKMLLELYSASDTARLRKAAEVVGEVMGL